MDVLIMVGQLLLSLSILVLLHEYGHYAAARLFGTRVEKFYLFFDFLFPFSNLAKFSLFKFKRGDTEYGIGWFPLGGYVKIAGMIDETTDKEALAQPPQPWEFRSKPAWQRLIIILGGIIVNLILGILILWMVKFTWGDKYIPLDKVTVAVNDSTWMKYGLQTGDRIIGYESSGDIMHEIIFNDLRRFEIERGAERKQIILGEDVIRLIMKNPKEAYFEPRIPFVIGSIPKKSLNKKSDLKAGDQIIKIDTVDITYLDQYRSISSGYEGKTIDAVVLRNGETITMPLSVSEDGLLEVGIASLDTMNKRGLLPIEVKKYGFFEAFPVAVNAAVKTITDQVKQFKLLFNPSTGAYKQIGGFASIGKMFSPVWDWEHFWNMTALLSLVLAFMNFLPIPMLDGGYMIFILYEMITRRKPSDKFMEVANTVGFVIVLGLLLFANGNDIFKIFTGK